jgi:hypothetical protein
MKLKNIKKPTNQRLYIAVLAAGGSVILAGTLVATTSVTAFASSTTGVDLGTAGSYSVLAGSTVTNTGNSTLQGSLGLWPGTATTGFPPGQVGGATNIGNADASRAQTDATAAYTQTANMTPVISQQADLAGLTLDPGVYSVPAGTSNLTGTLTLDGKGNPDAVFVFQMPSTLITSSASNIVLTNDANPCNIYWQVSSSATFGTDSSFQGTVIALTSITVNTNTAITGHLFARNGAVTLDSDTVSNPVCLAATTTTPPTTTTTTPPTTAKTPTTTTITPPTTAKTPTTTTTTPPTTAKTPTTTTTTPTGATIVPATHTGEPWSGWPWWLGIALMGSAGVLLIRPRSARAHRAG